MAATEKEMQELLALLGPDAKLGFDYQTGEASQASEYFKLKDGQNHLRLLPGMGPDAVIEVGQHWIRSDSNWLSFNCLCNTGGRNACPVCNYGWKLWRQKDPSTSDLSKTLRATTRFFVNVLVRDADETPLIWSMSHTMWTKLVEPQIAAAAKVGDEVLHPINGFDICVTQTPPVGGERFPTQTVTLARKSSPLAYTEEGESDIENIAAIMKERRDLNAYAAPPDDVWEKIGRLNEFVPVLYNPDTKQLEPAAIIIEEPETRLTDKQMDEFIAAEERKLLAAAETADDAEADEMPF